VRHGGTLETRKRSGGFSAAIVVYSTTGACTGAGMRNGGGLSMYQMLRLTSGGNSCCFRYLPTSQPAQVEANANQAHEKHVEGFIAAQEGSCRR